MCVRVRIRNHTNTHRHDPQVDEHASLVNSCHQVSGKHCGTRWRLLSGSWCCLVITIGHSVFICRSRIYSSLYTPSSRPGFALDNRGWPGSATSGSLSRFICSSCTPGSTAPSIAPGVWCHTFVCLTLGWSVPYGVNSRFAGHNCKMQLALNYKNSFCEI